MYRMSPYAPDDDPSWSAAASRAGLDASKSAENQQSTAGASVPPIRPSSTTSLANTSITSGQSNGGAGQSAAAGLCQKAPIPPPKSALKSVSRIGTKVMGTAKTPAKKFLSFAIMGGERHASRDADYIGDDAPFSPHLFVNPEDDWYHDNIEDGRAEEGTTMNGNAWEKKGSINNGGSKILVSSAARSQTPEIRQASSSPPAESTNVFDIITSPAAHSVSLAVGSVTLTPLRSTMPPPPQDRLLVPPKTTGTAVPAPPPTSTGMSKYYTPREYVETPKAGRATVDNDTNMMPACSVSEAIEAEASPSSPNSRAESSGGGDSVSVSSSRSFRWRRNKTNQGSSRRSTSPREASSSHDDEASVSTIVSARSIGGGSYEVLASNDDDSTVVSVHDVHAAPKVAATSEQPKRHKSLRALLAKGNGDNNSASSRSLVSTLTADECQLSLSRDAIVDNCKEDGAKEKDVTLTERTLHMSNIRKRPSAIPEEQENASGVEGEKEEESYDSAERLGASPNSHDDSVLSPPPERRSAKEIAQAGAAARPDPSLSVDTSHAPPSNTPSASVTYAPNVTLPPTPPPAPPLSTSPNAATNLAFAKSMARSQLNSQIDAMRSGKKKAARPLRPELLEDDFEDYFDSICPHSLYVSINSGRKYDMNDIADGLTWNTSLSDVRIDLAEYDSPPPSRSPSPAGATSPNSHQTLSPGGENRRQTMQAKANWRKKREYVKTKLKVREDMAVGNLCGSFGFSTGLARILHRSTIHKLPLRVWLVDNSGSMGTGDGRRFVDGSKINGRVSQMIPCTRWEELKACVLFHAEMAASIGAPTIFRLLNDPNVFIREEYRQAGEDVSELETLPQVVGVCARRNEGTATSSRLRNMMRFPTRRHSEVDEEDAARQKWEGLWELDLGASDDADSEWRARGEKDLNVVENVLYETVPSYQTPLAGHIWAVYEQIKGICSALSPGQRVAIVIASDGVPNQPESFLDAMMELQKLPVYLIVRLCTNDDASMHFWNTLDLDLDIPVEILDDFEAEAEAAFNMNPWCNYCMPLQRLREWGFRTKLLEKLRERPLTHDELHDYMALIFGVKKDALPDPREDWEGFYYDIEALNARERRQYNPLVKRNRGWIDLKRMAKIYGGKMEVARLKAVKEVLKQEERMRKEREQIVELRKKAVKKAQDRKVLPRASLLQRQHDPHLIGLGHC